MKTPSDSLRGAIQTADMSERIELASMLTEREVKLLGLEAAIQTRTVPDKGVFHRVRIGPYSDVEELNRVRAVLTQNGIDAALVKVREADK